MPALAGIARMPYSRFLVFNAAGGLTWGVAVVIAGYLAGESYARVESALGKDAAVVVLAVAAVAFAVYAVRRHRRPPQRESRASPRDC